MNLNRAHILALLATAPLAACGRRLGSTGGAADGAIAVGSKNFTEELILGEIYAQTLERGGLHVSRRLDLGGTDIAMAALQRGQIDLYPEYTGTALVNQLHRAPISDANAAYAAVKAAYAKQYDLVWLRPSPFNDSQALAATQATANAHRMRTLSDVAREAPHLVLGAIPEFLHRADGLPGLQKAYGGFRFKAIKQLDNGLKYQALKQGDVDVVVAFTTDGQIAADRLVVFADDKHLFPAYQVAPVVRKATLEAHPEIAKLLDAVAPSLTTETMQQLNLLVDGPKKTEPADAARTFLQRIGRG